MLHFCKSRFTYNLPGQIVKKVVDCLAYTTPQGVCQTCPFYFAGEKATQEREKIWEIVMRLEPPK